MRLYVSHGDKGGVGKSLLSMLMIDHLLHQHGAVTAIEGDGTIGDVARRYQVTKGVSGMSVDLSRPDGATEAAMALFEALEEAGSPENVVLNLPASASATLDQVADIFAETAAGLGYRLHVGWLIAGDDDSCRLAVQSALCRAADHRVAVVNDRVPSAWATWQARQERKEWLGTGGQEARLPALVERAAVVVREQTGPTSDLVLPSAGLPLVTRTVIRQWQAKCNDGPVAALIGEEEERGSDDE